MNRAGLRAPAKASDRAAFAYLAAAALAGTALLFLRSPWIVPAGQALPAYLLLLRDLRAGRPGLAIRHMLVWAGLLSAGVIAASALAPSHVEPAVLHGAAYREEMYLWIRTGVGAESSPALFIPQHVKHYLATLVLSLLTAGAAGLLLGAVLLNYMDFYVGSLIHDSARPWIGALFGWPAWSVVRVTGFVIGSVAVAQVTVRLLQKQRPVLIPEIRRMLLVSAILALADIALKAAVAPLWRRILERALLP